MPHGQKIRQQQYCNKLNKHFKMVHIQKKKKNFKKKVLNTQLGFTCKSGSMKTFRQS